ncbi:hypothetical protein ACHIPZ_23760 [Antrihabitans sp. NCIMB 15449]|uniref:Uncharacterized protein n=1 Tax=Antrihabitans spumae TaxID=3373370 RepID=A0ABW7JXE2_9NOCA
MIFSKSSAVSADSAQADADSELLAEPAQGRSYSSSLRLLGSGATTLARGTGGLGFLLAQTVGQTGYTLAKKGLAKARESKAELSTFAEDVPAPKSSKLRSRLVAGGLVGAALAAGAGFFAWSRRRNSPPPVAEAPPTLGPSSNGSAPAQSTQAEVSHPS